MLTKISSTAISTWVISFMEQPARSISPSTKARTSFRLSRSAATVISAMSIPPGRLVDLNQQHGDVVRLLRPGGKSGDITVQERQLLLQGFALQCRPVEEGLEPRLGVQGVLRVQRLGDAVGIEEDPVPRAENDLLLPVRHILHPRQDKAAFAGQPVIGP